jgi:hypothetical protein
MVANLFALPKRLQDKITPEPMSGCWLWTGMCSDSGYGILFDRRGKQGLKPRNIRVHRLVFSVIKGPIPQGQCILHKCDVRSCVNPDHLWLGSRLDNNRDCIAKGRRIAARRLTDEQFDYIISNKNKIDPKLLAEQLGVSSGHIYALWRHGKGCYRDPNRRVAKIAA